jgi:uncharacterized protein (TIGR04255 family)
MALPESPRIIYRRNPLGEVVVHLRFPPILRIDSEPPAAFQDEIRADYPQYADASAKPMLPPNLPPQILSLMQGLSAGRTGAARHQFSTQDKKWQVGLTRESFELKTSSYTRWETFRGRLVRLRGALEAVYRPGAYSRIGLRYVNVIRRSSIGLANAPWSELLAPYIAGELSAPELADGIDSASSQMHCRIADSDCFLTLKTGIVLAEPEKERCFLIDGDFHTHGNTEMDNVLDTLDRFNRTSGRLFRWCIKQRLHDALEPRPASDVEDVG